MPTLADMAGVSGTAKVRSRGQQLTQDALAQMAAQEEAQRRAAEWLMSQPDAIKAFLASLQQRVRGASLAELAENPAYVAQAQAGGGQAPMLRNLAADVIGAAGEFAPSRLDVATAGLGKLATLGGKMGVAAPMIAAVEGVTPSPTMALSFHEGKTGEKSHLTAQQIGMAPVAMLKEIQGQKGEIRGQHRNRQGKDWEKFKKDIAKRGIKEKILIIQEYGKPPRIYEGNHRLDAAMELGMEFIPAEIRYFGNSQQQGLIVPKEWSEQVENAIITNPLIK